MIPIVVLVTLAGGLFLPRHGVWVVVAAIVVWIGIVMMWGSIATLAEVGATAALAAVNAIVGFFIGRVLRRALRPVQHPG